MQVETDIESEVRELPYGTSVGSGAFALPSARSCIKMQGDLDEEDDEFNDEFDEDDFDDDFDDDFEEEDDDGYENPFDDVESLGDDEAESADVEFDDAFDE